MEIQMGDIPEYLGTSPRINRLELNDHTLLVCKLKYRSIMLMFSTILGTIHDETIDSGNENAQLRPYVQSLINRYT